MISAFVSRIKQFLKVANKKKLEGFDKYQKFGAYHWRELQTNSGYKELIDHVVKFMKPSDSVLDIGCGDGAYLGYAASFFKEGVGIDADFTAVELANQKFREHSLSNCKSFNFSIDEAKVFFASNDSKFDLIWSADVLEHLEEPEELIILIKEALKPDGFSLVGTPLFLRDDLVSPYHVKEYSVQELREIITPHLKIVREDTFTQKRKDRLSYDNAYYFALCKQKS
jgi:2-polyprenyl-3-methyl-5-hydroxy-6-metoxy-1,4-benzoquinol methylase